MFFEDTVIETTIFLSLVVLVWIIYAYYVHFQARQSNPASLSYNLRQQREGWVRRILQRDDRISDAALLAGQARVSTFFATSCLLILATLISAINSGLDLSAISREFFGSTPDIPQSALRHKSMVTLLSLSLIFLFSFFKFTWGVRQYGFVSVLLGNAPMPYEARTDAERDRFVFYMAQLIDHAGHNSNSGLRGFYFCLPILSHILSPVIGVLTLFTVVLVLYDRELNSYTITCIRESNLSFSEPEIETLERD